MNDGLEHGVVCTLEENNFSCRTVRVKKHTQSNSKRLQTTKKTKKNKLSHTS